MPDVQTILDELHAITALDDPSPADLDRGEELLAQAEAKRKADERRAAIYGAIHPLGMKSGTAAPTSHTWARAFDAWLRPGGMKAVTLPPSGSALAVPSITSLPEGDRPPEGGIAPLCTRLPADSGTYEYFQAGPRVTSAAVVPAGQAKPVSDYPVTRKVDQLATVAHISSAFNKADLEDGGAALGRYIGTSMVLGLMREVDDQIVNGDGTGDNPLGVLNTPGTLGVAWATDLLTTTRKAVTALLTISDTVPTAWAFSPADAELIDLAKNSQGDFYGAGPFSSGPNTLWGIPRTTSKAVPAGTGILGDWRAVLLFERDAVELRVTDTATADSFGKNQIHIRAEQRIGVGVTLPWAFAEVDLTAT